MLTKGDQLPHFTVAAHDGRRVAYADFWQRKNLLLVLADAAEPAGEGTYLDGVAKRLPELAGYDAACLITRDPVPGVPRPGIVIADRWGEIQTVMSRRAGEGPSIEELADWLSYVQSRCPECEGEAR
jgi:hypothetical protein